ncbi:ATP-binding protein [Enterococcus cecorum]|nr:ATP-binding protein [Enterococcus cecorum]
MKYKFFKRYIDRSESYDEFKNFIFFEQNFWDDYGYRTTFESYKVTENGKLIKLGSVNIAKLLAAKNQDGLYETFNETVLKEELNSLPDGFVFLGDEDFYLNLHKHYNQSECKQIFNELKDICFEFNEDKANNLLKIDVIKTSFFRGFTVEGAYNHIVNKLKPMSISGKRKGHDVTYKYIFGNDDMEINFITDLNMLYPQNVHAIIGNNGIGKTTFLKDILNLTISQKLEIDSKFNKDGGSVKVQFYSNDEIKVDSTADYFSKVVFISFSPFDKMYLTNGNSINSEKLEYIGIYRKGKEASSIENFLGYFKEKVKTIFDKRSKFDLFYKVLKMQNLFYDDNVKIDFFETQNELLLTKILSLFDVASAGQKIILLSIATLIAEVEQNCLVLIDEPELFLHPPLISNYIRSISKILESNNGLCILTTHSPIIIQEIPKDCVKIMNRDEKTIFKMVEPEFETFGENLSTLTNTIFELDQYKSGFYLLIKDIIDNPQKYDLTEEDILNLQFGRDGMLYKDLLLYEQKEDKLC